MNTSMWALILQAALPVSIDLVNSIIGLIQKQASGKELTESDWDALATKWAQKTAANYLADALAKSGAVK